MALKHDDAVAPLKSPADEQLFELYDKLYHHYSRLKKSLYYTRRCSEGFRTTHWEWSLLRSKISKSISYLCHIIRISADEMFVEEVCQLLDDLPQDKVMTEDILTVFNEYLGYAADIKRLIEDVSPGNISEIVLRVVKEQSPELVPRVNLSSTEKLSVFDLVSLLERNAVTLHGCDSVLSKTEELLRFLSIHWDIIEELAVLEQNKGPVQDIILFPDKFLDNVKWEERKVTYYDLVSNLSVTSAVNCAVSELLQTPVEERLQSGVEKLEKLQLALDNRTKRMSMFTELLIADT